MKGQIGLFIRIALIALFGFIAGTGIADFDPIAGTLTLRVDPLVDLLVTGMGGILATFGASRVVKRRGGTT